MAKQTKKYEITVSHNALYYGNLHYFPSQLPDILTDIVNSKKFNANNSNLQLINKDTKEVLRTWENINYREWQPVK